MSLTLKVATVVGAVALLTGLALLGQNAALLGADSGGPVPPSTTGEAAPEPAQPRVTNSDLERATSIALAQHLIDRLGGPSSVTVNAPQVWTRANGEPIGVVFELMLSEPASGSYPFIVHQYRDRSPKAPPYQRYTVRMDVESMESMTVAVDLNSGRVAEMAPAPGTNAQLAGSKDGRHPSENGKRGEG